MNEKLTILFVPMNQMGHLNPLIGFGQNFVPKHRVIFAVNKSLKGQLTKYGFEEAIMELDDPHHHDQHKHHHHDHINNELSKEAKYLAQFHKADLFLKMAPINDKKAKEIVERIKPDLLVLDATFILPATIKAHQGPWISLVTPNPNSVLFDERSPPPGLGLPADDPSSWKQIYNEIRASVTPVFKRYDDWYEAEGLSVNPNEFQWSYHSPHLNVYAYPLELDYTDLRPNPPNWVRINTIMIKPKEEFVVPEKLKNLPGKLIYFSLGSNSFMNNDLMKKLINYMSFSPHRFIVSKGKLGDEYDLPDNCWGENFVPQTAVLKIVDLAIIHGGNNSVCESLYHGKPMIAMPLQGDQFDNAQRVQEKGFGIRLDPHSCTKQQLLNSIERLLNDKELNTKLKSIASRCELESKTNKIVELVEQMINEYHKN